MAILRGGHNIFKNQGIFGGGWRQGHFLRIIGNLTLSF